ncbi:hypothetical protein [Nonomuraea diastatica]|uniref:Uncharacterized protein n=1 Tax=Nonomuraea diastatica TaxID=1848329 RepID=A0A4R4WNS1_9ACTN|nr:hypothetical protein [Nonomuraea diastatica]TDD18423.1 hypothetical protein E1294_24385 [Nonomuraea diastatica]
MNRWDVVKPRSAAEATDCDEILRLTAVLDSCLLTEEEEAVGPDTWACYDDPFDPILTIKETA